MLTSNTQVMATPAGEVWTVGECLGAGAQAEVYRCCCRSKAMALKWYRPAQATPQQRANLQDLINLGPPSGAFLWPAHLVTAPDRDGFGYLMPLRPAGFVSLSDLVTRRVDPSLNVVLTTCADLVDSFSCLHALGLCYRDISMANVFVDPRAGAVRICDNDNVAVEGRSTEAVFGTLPYMAPEIVLGLARPSAETDLHSLAVLLFYLLFLSHPLDGEREANIHCKDQVAMRHLYGERPVFIFDPHDDSNRPVPGLHDNALVYWDFYPSFLRDLVTRAFTVGLRDTRKGRVRESEWRSSLARLREAVHQCPACGADNLADDEASPTQRRDAHTCWACGAVLPRMALHKRAAAGAQGSGQTRGRITPPDADLVQYPTDPTVFGLKNMTAQTWWVTHARLAPGLLVAPNKAVRLLDGIRIQSGSRTVAVRILSPRGPVIDVEEVTAEAVHT